MVLSCINDVLLLLFQHDFIGLLLGTLIVDRRASKQVAHLLATIIMKGSHVLFEVVFRLYFMLLLHEHLGLWRLPHRASYWIEKIMDRLVQPTDDRVR